MPDKVRFVFVASKHYKHRVTEKTRQIPAAVAPAGSACPAGLTNQTRQGDYDSTTSVASASMTGSGCHSLSFDSCTLRACGWLNCWSSLSNASATSADSFSHLLARRNTVFFAISDHQSFHGPLLPARLAARTFPTSSTLITSLSS